MWRVSVAMKLVLGHAALLVTTAVFVSGAGEWSEDAEDLVSTVDVDAVLGRTASLPCDVTPDTNEDRVYMVLWFRKSGGKPIYSFDVRGRSFNKALQWSDPGAFGPRAYFATVARPASLTLSSVQLDDEGTYRCRVDFKNSPTRNFQIRLVVIVPPHQMLLYDKSGADISGVIGPLEEGSALILICEVRGGRPEPVVTWLIDGHSAAQYIGEKTDTHVVVNRLELQHVRREDLNKTFKCRATNTNLVPPQEKAVRLEMNLAPLSISLLSRPQQLLAGSAATLRCVAEGSRPPAQITWYKDNRSFEKDKITDHSNETWSVSTLIFSPSPDDHGVIVKCVASNPALPGKTIDDHVKLNVVYSPLVTLSLGSTLNPHDIKEGDDVYFECNVRANPREHRISWYHNDRAVTQNVTTGIIVSTRSLVMQGVTRQDAGRYACRAANARGETSSESVNLRVQYAPVCGMTSPQVVGAALDESLHVRCSVHADPADVTFLWQFNNSGESFDVSPARYDAPVCGMTSPQVVGAALDESLHVRCSVHADPADVTFLWQFNNSGESFDVSPARYDAPVCGMTSPQVVGAALDESLHVRCSVHADPADVTFLWQFNNSGESFDVSPARYVALVCGMTSPNVVGAALDESLHVRCSVHADPADVTFLWQFNNSGESFDVSPARYATLNGSTSELRYTPASERDYGALTCRGTNTVGQQAQPCVFQIVPAARPSPPRNCTVFTGNDSSWIDDATKEEASDYLEVRCVAGYDGGLPQLVVLEALDSITGRIRFNVTANETNGLAVFLVPAEVLWSSGAALRLSVYSRNEKGSSDKIVIQALSYQDPERRTDGSHNLMAGMSSGAFWAIVLTISLCMSIALMTALFLRRRRAQATSKQNASELQLNAGDGQYVVAYTLKPHKQAQPDILNPPPDGSPLAKRAGPVKNGALHTSDEWPDERRVSIADKVSISSTSTVSSKPITVSSTALSRREHLIAEEIPGPESCV